MNRELVPSACLVIIGLLTALGAFIWSLAPTDGANIGAGLLCVLGVFVAFVGILIGVLLSRN
jgi:hypothetical protein